MTWQGTRPWAVHDGSAKIRSPDKNGKIRAKLRLRARLIPHHGHAGQGRRTSQAQPPAGVTDDLALRHRGKGSAIVGLAVEVPR
jgi:hypothetical protein